jgi:dTDP-4-dehydrorhamnose reductase
MRVLVTGITGQVGGALVTRLQAVGTVVPTDETTFDFNKLNAIAETLDSLAPDLIINPAAYTAVDKAEDEPDLAMRVNGEAPGIIARWAAKHDVPLLHFSTDYVYDGHGESPWHENDKAHPLSVYGSSKLAGDNEVHSSGCCCLIVRTCWVYAAHGKNFLRTIAQLAQGRKQLRIVADQIGAPTSAALIADAILLMVSDGLDRFREQCARANGLVHLAASGETSWHGFALAIVAGLKQRGVPLAVEHVIPIRSDEYPTRAKRPHNSRLDLTRLQNLFGIKPAHWQTALAPELDEVAREIISADQGQL